MGQRKEGREGGEKSGRGSICEIFIMASCTLCRYHDILLLSWEVKIMWVIFPLITAILEIVCGSVLSNVLEPLC